MTTTDTTVNNLIINTMTQAQYSQITPDPNQLYMVTDSTITSSEVTNALGYTPANDSGLVHNTGTETIAGEKTFTDKVYHDKNLYVKNTDNNAYEPVLTYPSSSDTYATKRLGNVPSDVTSIPPTTLYNFDGQFVQSKLTISTNTKINNYVHYIGTTGPNPLNYLPDNDYVYMVYGQIISNSNVSSQHWLGTGSTPATNVNCFRVLSRTASSSVLGINYFALPVVPDSNGYQILYEQIINANIASSASIDLYGYRRIGTNS